jgi:hypothetical protein
MLRIRHAREADELIVLTVRPDLALLGVSLDGLADIALAFHGVSSLSVFLRCVLLGWMG